MLSAETAGALVPGGASALPAAGGVRVRALLAFMWDGQRREAGETFDCARGDARMLAHGNRVEILPPEPAASPEPQAETARPPRARRAQKEPAA